MSGGAMTIGDGNSSFADSRPQALLKCTDLSKDSLNTDGAAEARSSSSSSSSNKAVESSDPHAVVEMLKKELKRQVLRTITLSRQRVSFVHIDVHARVGRVD